MKTKINITLDSELLVAVDKLATSENRNRSNMIESIIRNSNSMEDKMKDENSTKIYTETELIDLTGGTPEQFVDAFIFKTAEQVNAIMIEMMGLEGDDMNFAEQIVREVERVHERIYGPVLSYNGVKVALTQEAYLDNNKSQEACYKSRGVDADGNTYYIEWTIKDGFDGDDESNACDWGKYYIEKDR